MKTVNAFIIGAVLAALYQPAHAIGDGETPQTRRYIFGAFGNAQLSVARPELTEPLSTSRATMYGYGWAFSPRWSVEFATHDFGEFTANAEKLIAVSKTVEYQDVHITPPRVIRLPDGRYVFGGPITTRDTHVREITYTARIPGTVEASVTGLSAGVRFVDPGTGLFIKGAMARVDGRVDVSALGVSKIYRRTGTLPMAEAGVKWGAVRLSYLGMPKYSAIMVGVEVGL